MNVTVTCPTGCAGALPPVSFNKCAPDTRVSEITHLLIGKNDAAALADATSPTEWAGRLDDTATVGDKIRKMIVRGNKPATTKTEQTLTLDRKVITNREHVINFIVDEVNDENYDFARTTQCGIISFKVWYVNNNTKDLFGGAEGIDAVIFMEAVYDEGTGVLQKFVGTVKWNSMQDPPRELNPIAGF
jgi:hypothetical protein